MTPYQAQYFWHSARQHPGRDASPLEVLADLPRPLALVAWVGVFVWLGDPPGHVGGAAGDRRCVRRGVRADGVGIRMLERRLSRWARGWSMMTVNGAEKRSAARLIWSCGREHA